MQVFKRKANSVGSPTWQYLCQGHSDSMVEQYAPCYSSLTKRHNCLTIASQVFSYLSKYFHSAASSAISSIAESVACWYWNTFFSFRVNFSSFLCPDYHHSSSIKTGSMCSSQELLIGGVCGSLGSPRSPFLFQRLLVVFPKLGLQLLSVVKEVHELNLHSACWQVIKRIPFKGDTFSHGCHISRAQSGVLPSLSLVIQL